MPKVLRAICEFTDDDHLITATKLTPTGVPHCDPVCDLKTIALDHKSNATASTFDMGPATDEEVTKKLPLDVSNGPLGKTPTGGVSTTKDNATEAYNQNSGFKVKICPLSICRFLPISQDLPLIIEAVWSNEGDDVSLLYDDPDMEQEWGLPNVTVAVLEVLFHDEEDYAESVGTIDSED